MFELLTFGTVIGLALGVIIGLLVGVYAVLHATAPQRDYVRFKADSQHGKGCQRDY
ncbi:hypothetical protein AB0F73_13635 [Micromonospora purpureochromogenes]|uniref:hypothetical protein n=1 Tax=Micromonospora purpureochromogenes TaxID=47872 RepID=UPI0033F501E4